MAEASISEDHFMCSVCLDLLKDPVTVPCGHTYCMRCITDCWNQEDQTRIYSCPQCRQTFSPRPVLGKNVMFAEMMEKLKKTKVKCAVSDQCSSGAGDVECDVCTGRKHKAIKSCLLCLNSYCQTHLEQHENLFRGKRHNLIDATAPLHDMICPQHDKILEIYCRTDQQCVCNLCKLYEHKNHEIVSSAAAWTEKQSQFGETKNKVQQQIQKKQKDLQKIKDVVESHKRCAQTAVEDCEMMFTELISSIERRRSEVTQLIRDQETAAVSSAEGLLERLKQEIDDLRRRDAELEKLLHTQHHIHLLQSLSSLSVPPGSTDSLSSITVSSLLSFDDVITSVSHLRDKLERLCKGELEKISERGLASCGQSLSDRPLQTTTLTQSRPSASISSSKPPAGSWTCDTCLIRNMSSDKRCISCGSPRLNIESDSDSKPAVATASLLSLFTPPAGSWTCDICLIINKPEVVKCVCCDTAKPGTQVNSSLISPSLTKASSAASSSTTTTSSTGTGLLRFGDKCKAPEGSWDCDVCLVHNNPQDVKCVACKSPKPGAEAVPVTSAPASTPDPLLGLRHKFKTPEGNWECEVCCVLNKAEDQNCVACQSKPKAKIQFRGDSSCFGVPAPCTFIAPKSEKDDAPESSETILNTTTSSVANTIPVECQPGDPKFECRQDHLTGPPSPSFAFGKSVEAKVSSLTVFGQKPTPAPTFGSTDASSAQGIFEGGFGGTSEVWAGSAAPSAPAVSPVPVPFSFGQTPASNILSSGQNSSKDFIATRKIKTTVRRRK